ncbi:MAG TPA: biotin carboxylase N-terminal domain-containing protein [Solirubrobacteraceae bacterium]|jgi:acetyl/propionyl-CoA carboxylase alpha subunit
MSAREEMPAPAPPEAVTSRPITKLLVANRGEIVRRINRTAREMGIATVAVFSEPDRDAPFAREADEAVALGGATPAESYLRGDAHIDAARRTGADAIHPGYGFLAENAEFARSCQEAGILFVGPSPEAIAAMGSKIQAKALMRDAGVPVLDDLTAHHDLDDDELCRRAGELGWPLLAKASAGGGGKGMRIVTAPDALLGAIASARREAAAAFGDDTLFLERYVESSRHVEIQIFGDHHGNVATLFERECSIQRRHQKIVEESPSPALDEELRGRMCAAAIAAGRSLGYVGAGTVEFLLTPAGEFFFLEVNTRLQVEHPVTELVTGLDLVRLQLEVAEGLPLPPAALEPTMRGHAIEVRLYAEDPEQDFLPQTGQLTRFVIPTSEGVRVDTGVASGSEISVHYDPMVAKVIAHAPTRRQAAARLACTLRLAELHGLTTNRDFLVRLLEHPEFLAGDTDTHFLERHAPGELGAPLLGPEAERVHAAAAALAAQAGRRRDARVLSLVPSGFRNNPSQPQSVAFEGTRGALAVEYRFLRGALFVRVEDQELSAPRLHACAPDLVDLEVDGIRRRYRVRRDGGTWWVNSALGQAALRELARFPSVEEELAAGSLSSPMPGIVLRVRAQAGDEVQRGSALVVIEAMKMEHEIVAPADGTVSEVLVSDGQQVEAGTVLVVIDEHADA